MKIAIISSGDLSEMKGIMNYVHEKAKHLQQTTSLTCDIYILRSESSLLFSLLTKKSIKGLVSKRHLMEKITYYDGVSYHNLWYSYGLFSNIFVTKLRKQPLGDYVVARFLRIFKDYDVVASHTLVGHYLAAKIKQKYKIPFVATWHGSDINVDPFKYSVSKKYTSVILKNADANLFVSRALLEASGRVYSSGRKDVIYTGPSEFFKRLSIDEVLKYRNEHQSRDGEIILGFIGNLIPIKNVLKIPEILAIVRRKLQKNSKFIFWVAGNGSLQEQLEEQLKRYNIPYKFFGKLLPREIPLFMNCLDVLLLPSLNEGLPLVALEAKKCGVHVVASNVGGIKECIGEQNCFNLDDKFSENMSTRIVQILSSKEPVTPLDPVFSWESAIEKEVEIYNNILNNCSYAK